MNMKGDRKTVAVDLLSENPPLPGLMIGHSLPDNWQNQSGLSESSTVLQ